MGFLAIRLCSRPAGIFAAASVTRNGVNTLFIRRIQWMLVATGWSMIFSDGEKWLPFQLTTRSENFSLFSLRTVPVEFGSNAGCRCSSRGIIRHLTIRG
jgi:hypothetical protein